MVSLEDLQEGLVAGKTYTIIYSETIMGGNILEVIYSDQYVFLDVSASVNDWNMERTKCVIALVATIGMEVIALILIDRLWCKKEYARIKELSSDIEARKERMTQRAERNENNQD